MKYFFEKHSIITTIIASILLLIAIVCSWLLIKSSKNIILNGNEQIIDINYRFTWGIIELGNGELIEGQVTSWKDYNESDMIQVTMNNITYLTHSSNVILCSEKP